MMAVLTKLWRGEYSLPLAFLGFFVFGMWAALFVAAVVLFVFYQLQLHTFGAAVACLLIASYWFITSVGAWRSAGPSIASKNWVNRIEGLAARGVILLLAAYVLWSLWDRGALWLMQHATT
jgi:hypothetical protein